MSRRWIRAILAVVCWVVSAPAVLAQTAWLQLQPGAAGQWVGRLQSDTPPTTGAVWLELDGQRVDPRSITPVAPGGSRALVICLDRSGSMKGAGIAAVRAALNDSLAAREGGARLSTTIAIIAFGSRVEILTDFTDDPGALRQAIDRYAAHPAGEGKTRLHDAVLEATAMLRQGHWPARRVLVITDGKDEGSKVADLETVLNALARERPTIFVDGIGFGELAAQESGSIGTIAGRSGGRFAFALQQPALAAAIVKMVHQTVDARQYDVVLEYPAARDGRPARSARLVYQPTNGDAVTLAAPSMPAMQAPATAEPRLWWERLFDAIARIHIGLKIVIGGIPLVMLAALAFYLLRRRRIVLLKRYEVEVRSVQAPESPTRAPEPETRKPPEKPAAPARRSTIVGHRWPQPGNGRVVAVLFGIGGPGNGRQFKLTASSARVGAGIDNDLVLDQDEYASARHAQMKAENFGLYVTDLGSTNGTAVNGVSIRADSRALVPGDKVRFGSSIFEVRTADDERFGHTPVEQATG